MNLYEFRWRWMTHRRSLGRNTGARMTRGFALRLTIEGIVLAPVVYTGLTYALNHTL